MLLVAMGPTELQLHDTERDSGKANEGDLNSMLDTIFAVSTLVFFVAGILYVKFCDGLR